MYLSALILNAKNAKTFVVIPKIASACSHRCIFVIVVKLSICLGPNLFQLKGNLIKTENVLEPGQECS